MSQRQFCFVPAKSGPALRITSARAGCHRQLIAALAAAAFADGVNPAAHPGIILADQQRDVLGHFVWFTTRAPVGAVPRQHFLLLLIQHYFNFALTGGGLPRALRGFAYLSGIIYLRYLPV